MTGLYDEIQRNKKMKARRIWWARAKAERVLSELLRQHKAA